jgi:UDP-3-O-[3-hydroxymyristoyl] glucosamine N-acyltransferase
MHAEGGYTTLDVVNSTVMGNIAMGDGGGIYNNTGTLELATSTVSGNSAADHGGGIYHVAQFGTRTVTLTNSTVSSNSAVEGGGIFNRATLSLTNSTVAGNSTEDSHGGGVYNAGGTLELINSIVAAQAGGEDCIGSIMSLGHNLDSDGTCGLTAPSDIPDTDPRLGPLADNGGPTETHALLPGSPAIDAGDDGVCPATDQRGIERPQGAACDIGAYEYESTVIDPTLTVNSTGEAVDAIPGDGLCETATPGECTLQAAIMEANALPGPNVIELAVPGPYVLATPDYSPGEGRVPSGVPLIDTEITINGYGATIERSSAGGTPEFRIFYVVAGGELTLNGLTLRNGWVEGAGGAIWNDAGTLELNDTIVSGNRAFEGGGIVSGNGSVRLNNSTVSGNRGTWSGGIYNVGGTLELIGSTVSGNGTEGAPGGGIWNRGGMVKLTNSTVSGNHGTEGGGILNENGTIELTNSTISSNVAGFSTGGGIWNRGGMVRLTNSTVSNNRDDFEGGENINNAAGGTLELINTIVADQIPGNDCVGSITSLGHNLDSDGTCNLTGPGDLPNTEPGLGPLADNGGPTQTHALLPGSPAIDAGDDGACPATDQRGFVTRPQGAACDIGAYEYENSAPSATDDSYTVFEDEILGVATPDGVLSNDDDVDNDPLSAVLVGGVGHGALTLEPGGSFAYNPGADFNGEDTFTYKANDGYVDSNEATVTIAVVGVNDPPVAYDDAYTVDEDGTLIVAAPGLLGNDSDVDGDLLVPILVGGVSNGTLILNGDGSLTYTPDADFYGEDSFVYKANDGYVDSDLATVTLFVVSMNDRPVAVGDQAATNQDLPLTIDVLANDFDVEGDTLTVASVTQGAHGTVVNNGDGTVTYTRYPGFNGTDSFSYTIDDGQGGTDSASVKVTITPDITIPEDVTLGDGVVIGPGTTIKSGADIGDGATIGSDVTIGEDVTVGPGTTVEDGAELKGNASLGADSTLGAGAQLKEGASVGDSSVVGNNSQLKAGASVGDGAQIGEDVTLQENATAGNNLVVGDGTIVQDGVQLGDDVILGSEVLIGKSVVIGDRVSIGDRTTVKEKTKVGADTSIGADTVIGKGAQIGERVDIGNNVTVKAGVVIPDNSSIPDGSTIP